MRSHPTPSSFLAVCTGLAGFDIIVALYYGIDCLLLVSLLWLFARGVEDLKKHSSTKDLQDNGFSSQFDLIVSLHTKECNY